MPKPIKVPAGSRPVGLPIELAPDRGKLLEPPGLLAAGGRARPVTGPLDDPWGEKEISLPAGPLALAFVLTVVPGVPESSAFDDTSGVATGTVENP